MDSKKFEGFYKKTIKERQEILAKEFSLTEEEKKLLTTETNLPISNADKMIENVVGTYSLPFGVATNFVIDKKEYLIPFVLEEPSVVAAASNAAKLSNGFITKTDEPIMIGQIMITGTQNPEIVLKKILESKKEILKEAEKVDSVLTKFGGGPRDLKGEILNTPTGKIIELQLLVDVRDAMGANAINTMTEKITPIIEKISGGKALMRIISNLAIYRKAQAKTIWTKQKLEESTKGKIKGEEIIDRIIQAYEIAVSSPFRAATHNKGIMNGIDSLTIATGNDFRGVEAGIHSYAAYKEKGKYSPLTKYYKNENGDLVGEIELPITLATIGGTAKLNPMASLSLKILGVKNSKELASIAASVGLAQNFAALRAIVTTGIQAGHMKLHARALATQAGAKENEIEQVAEEMINSKEINQANAEKIIKKIRDKSLNN
ncbi:MAG: hydroxymethylglutaryl-CoA reductase, degradative [Candidatus Diapherotrites archaeon]|jgi:hydroxymethylglutaryl-CoA reductase|uniref:3-hydroxy-3-methylglutaryl coenzyme A reductase n=1 Tax=Candidatus Iainarchaeum sp. TaxID=3101447 RepID=A0A7K4BZK6_9ARCH|nr:hydroxymethylglutaryl-CoA reductase, degradative [Candidatus Diapherotrites archaeon]